MSKNMWKLYLGIAAEDKVYNDKRLKVYSQEILPFMSSIGDLSENQNIKYTDTKTNNVFTKPVSNTNILTCDYMDLATNRSGPPDIRQGEQVFVMQYSDTDKYFWFPMGRDDNLRRLERYRISVSDDKTVQKELTDDNTFFIEMDTLHHKHVIIKTSDSDGEEFIYTIKIDADNSFVKIFDNDDNEIVLESKVPRIRLKNKDGSFLDVFKKNVMVVAPEDIVLKADRQILINTKTLSLNTSEGMVSDSKEIAINADNVELAGNTVGLSGAIKLKGSVLSSPILAEGYSTGSAGSQYASPTNDLASGESTLPAPEADLGGDTSGNRHCTAQEQILSALTIIQQALIDTHNALGVLSPDINTLVGIGEASLMPKNTGE